jgi:hypothetical protein
MAESKTYRSSAGFGKRIEYWIIGQMLKEGMDVYVPLVDDHAVDAIIRKEKDGSIALIQIKARSRGVVEGDASLFAAITHDAREHYWFVFYSERMNLIWVMTSDEFLLESNQNKKGKNHGSSKHMVQRNPAKQNYRSNGRVLQAMI